MIQPSVCIQMSELTSERTELTQHGTSPAAWQAQYSRLPARETMTQTTINAPLQTQAASRANKDNATEPGYQQVREEGGENKASHRRQCMNRVSQVPSTHCPRLGGDTPSNALHRTAERAATTGCPVLRRRKARQQQRRTKRWSDG
jgi:hypothetical protein